MDGGSLCHPHSLWEFVRSGEAEVVMPLTYFMAARLGEKMTDVRMNGDLWWWSAGGAGGDSAVAGGKVQALGGCCVGRGEADKGCGRGREKGKKAGGGSLPQSPAK